MAGGIASPWERRSVRVCLIANQIAAWGKIGGFGTATRAIGAGLAKRGVEVSAVVPWRAQHGQRPLEQLDGITVYGPSAWSTLTSGAIFREIKADIYHSQEPTIATWLAQKAVPEAIHVVTCRDPRGMSDHLLELRYTNYKRRLIFPVTWYYEMSPWVKESVRRADAVFCPAPCITQRAKRLYGPQVEPEFVPSPTDLPEGEPAKSPEPMVIFVGRWDHRKRIERFFELAELFPEARLVAIGRAHDTSYDRSLRARYGHLANVEMPGFVPRFGQGGLYDLYGKAWVLVNTSVREGLPYTFVEGAAWGCAILSALNPDGFSERFGFFVEDDDFAAGLRWLLRDGKWRAKGRAGAEYVGRIFNEENSIREHLLRYERLSARGEARAEPLP
jgi:glycosyltransferase involved in cell wall biosynthesis